MLHAHHARRRGLGVVRELVFTVTDAFCAFSRGVLLLLLAVCACAIEQV